MFAEVLLPLAIQGTYTYRIPDGITVAAGFRVLVPFGRKKLYTGIVAMTHDVQPKGYDIKELIAVLDKQPIVRHPQLKFWQWIADYYLCTEGEVFKAAVPTGLKVESETFISVNPDYEESPDNRLSEHAKVIYNLVAQHDRLQIDAIARATGFKAVEGTVSKMLEQDAIHVSERVVDNYKPKTETCVRLAVDRDDEAALHAIFDQVRRSRKKEALVLAYLDLSHWLQRSREVREVTKAELLRRADASQAVLGDACQRGIFEVYKRPVNRFAELGNATDELPVLSAEQQQATHDINTLLKRQNIVLLHGVTSSGKTSIYMHFIADALGLGKQVLYLVPEIALTTQLTRRLRRVFGDRLLIYHSKFSDNERVDIWRRLLNSSEPCVVIGVRSSVFLPYANLGLVIVDEEHDTSYKQQDPAPRYNGRDAALVLAMMHGAKTILGSGTPAIETYYKAKTGKYGLVSLLTRYAGIKMPAVKVIDTREAWKKREMSGLFSLEMVRDCRLALGRGEQIILFQNRRGYSPMVRCKDCGWVPKCDNCDVSLTYHRHTDTLICHYCGHTITMPQVCPACGLTNIEVVGYGTERIEEQIDAEFPNEKISRMDLDTTRSKTGYDRIIDDFSNHKTNILVGTQMVTKGLDFDKVSVVGVLNADTMIRFPDFRAHERAFNMMEQVAGRAGRAHKQGQVIVQTSDPDHPVVDFVKRHDYLGFYEHEIAERERFAYPPFTKLINIYLRHRDRNVVFEMAQRYGGTLRQVFGKRVFGPQAPAVGRVQNFHIMHIMLKMETEASMPKVKKILRDIYEHLLTVDSRMKHIRLHYDVDPV